MANDVKGNWSGASAFNLSLALNESRDWIERVINEKFPSDDFQASLKNGSILCKLINQIKPGLVPKINTAKTDFAERENLAFFIVGCKKLGLKDTQVFEANDLFESKRVRNVAIALYWLGRAARGVPTYKGPHLNLLAFKGLNCTACKKPIKDNNYLATLSGQWHPQCARCDGCDAPLNPKEQFYQQGEKMFCGLPCTMGAMGSPSSPPGGKGGSKPGHKHGPHDDHEHCAGCHTDLDGKDYVPEGKDKYCTDCICDLCHNPLLGPFQIKDGKKVCDDCSCFECGAPLKDGYFDDGPIKFCPPCYEKKNKEKNPGVLKPLAPMSSPKEIHLHHDHDHDHSHDHPHSHDHSHHDHPHKHDHSSKPKGCKECKKPIDKKPKKGGDRDLYCDPHEKEFCCGKCDKEISGPVVEALGQHWHPPCFSCHNCHKDISKLGVPAKLDESGDPWCQPCFDARMSSCATCQKPIKGQGIEALGKKYHDTPQCFNCASCHTGFPKGDYHEANGNPYCDKCINDQQDWGPDDVCGGCHKPLFGKVTHVLDKFWHEGCFKCNRCKKDFTSGYFPYESDPYCKDCHHIVAKTGTCGVCSKPLEGPCVTSQGLSWHKPCFKCYGCALPLEKDAALTRFGKPYCKFCHAKEKLQCAKCRDVIKGSYSEDKGKVYCEKCSPSKDSHLYGDFKQGWTIDGRSSKVTARDRPADLPGKK